MKYAATIRYLGANYHGFERQKNLLTIQGKIEECLSSLVGEETLIKGAGRTDAGVSANGQVFSFSMATPSRGLPYFRYALNRLLPKDIVVTSLKEVPSSFDARHSAIGKIYSYSFHYGERDPFPSTEYQLEWPTFSFDAFMKAMLLYRGIHDFKNFTTKPKDKDNFIRNIYDITFSRQGEHFKTTLRSNGFMTYMVRIMVGVAIRVGEGKMTLEDVSSLLSSKGRKIVSFKADPKGLVLEEVLYGK